MSSHHHDPPTPHHFGHHDLGAKMSADPLSPLPQTSPDRTYPYIDGDVLVLGPQCFVSADRTTINYRGENFYSPNSAIFSQTKSQSTDVPELEAGRDTSGRDTIDGPAHYGGAADPYEAVKVIEAWGLGFNLGNTVKYISRAGKKALAKEIDDLKKAAWYLDRQIKRRQLEQS